MLLQLNRALCTVCRINDLSLLISNQRGARAIYIWPGNDVYIHQRKCATGVNHEWSINNYVRRQQRRARLSHLLILRCMNSVCHVGSLFQIRPYVHARANRAQVKPYNDYSVDPSHLLVL